MGKSLRHSKAQVLYLDKWQVLVPALGRQSLPNYQVSSQDLAVCEWDPLSDLGGTRSREGGRGAGRAINSILEIDDMIYGDQSALSGSMPQTEEHTLVALRYSPTPCWVVGKPPSVGAPSPSALVSLGSVTSTASLLGVIWFG